MAETVTLPPQAAPHMAPQQGGAAAASNVQQGASDSANTPPDPARQRRISNAIIFLKNPQVKVTPLSRRINFLKSKGLSEEEIAEAFEATGNPQTVESIRNIVNQRTTSTTAATGGQQSTSAPQPPPLPPQPPQQYQPLPQQQQPQHYQHPQQQPQHYQHPQQQPYHPPPPQSKWGWKDYFIAATLATVSTVGAFKVAQHFLPFEIVRKDQQSQGQVEDGINTNNSTTSPNRHNRNAPLKSPLKNRRGQSIQQEQLDTQSGSENTSEDVPHQGSFQQAQSSPDSAVMSSSSRKPQQRSDEQPKQPKAKPEELEKAHAEASQLKEQITTITDELEATKSSLGKERKEKADLAVSNGKLRGQIHQLGRTNEKQTQEINRLESELNQMIKKFEPPKEDPKEEAKPETEEAKEEEEDEKGGDKEADDGAKEEANAADAEEQKQDTAQDVAANEEGGSSQSKPGGGDTNSASESGSKKGKKKSAA